MTRSVHLLSVFFVTIIEVPDLIIPTYKHCVKFVVVMMVVMMMVMMVMTMVMVVVTIYV
jgi:hypothetical protein